MNIWSSRTKMEHAKTKVVPTSAKANGKVEEEDDIEFLEKTIDTQKETIQHHVDTISIMSGTIDRQEIEIKRLRELLDKNNVFMQQIIIELINKPAPKTAAQLYSESKLPAVVSNTAGPKGKLP